MSKNKIIYIGNFDFPFGNASGKRVYGTGKLLRELGYETIFIGMNKNVAAGTALVETRQEYDGFVYYNFSYPGGSKSWINYNRVYQQFTEWLMSQKEQVEAIICYGSPRLSMFITKVIKWGHKNGIKVMSDCVDWLESKTGNFVFDIAKTVDTYYQKAIANRKADGVICISSYLSRYYQKHKKKTVIIPPLSMNIAKEHIENTDRKLVLVYAGSPFRDHTEFKDLNALKDRVDLMIKLLYEMKKADIDFKFYYYGLDQDNYLSAFPFQKDQVAYLADSIEFCGFQPNDKILDKIRCADYTILLRDVKKATMAGFPTKVSESISNGTPIITTRTSDIDTYLQDGRQAVYIDQYNMPESVKAIKKVVESGRYRNMKQACAGNDIFYYASYCHKMKDFMESL